MGGSEVDSTVHQTYHRCWFGINKNFTSKSRSAIDKLKKDLSSEFEMKDLGEAKKVLGIKIERDQKVKRLA